MIYVFTGNGKGKTSSALGVVMRAVGNGMRVGWVSWYKDKSWKLSEVKSLKDLGAEMFLMGKGFSMDEEKKRLVDGSVVVDKAGISSHKKAARNALEKAIELINNVDVLVLDEINNAVDEKLIYLSDLIKLIERRGETHLVLTGRNVNERVVKLADLVTECKKIKHPYDSGNLAVKGLDF